MQPPRGRADAPRISTSACALAKPAQVSAGDGSARPLLAFGLAFGLVGGLLGAFEVVGVALAIALSQQQIITYTQQYTAYQECLRENPTPTLCQTPTEGALTVSAIWLLFLGASLLTFVLA